MSQENTYKLLIKSLNESELYVIAKLYLKDVDGIHNIIVTNGSWDSGIDLLNINKVEVQYQATVEENQFESKLWKDIKKAKHNVTEYNLPSKVKYFYSHSLSNTSIFKYKREAKEKFDIILDIVEANYLSQIAIGYSNIGSEIFHLSKYDTIQNDTDYFKDVKIKAFYDLMSFGKTTDIKYHIIKSFVLNYIFNHPCLDKKELLSVTNEHFGSKIEISYFDYFMGRLSSERRVILNKGFPTLSDSERERIDSVLQDFRAEEAFLIKEITTALNQYNIKDDKNEVITKLVELYESSYSVNLDEFTHKDSNIKDLKTATFKLKSLLASLNSQNSESDIENIAKKLIQISDSSELLPRIAAGQVYSKVSDPDRLQDYIRRNVNNKTIFLDANVLLYLLLVHYESEVEWDNYFFRVAKQFLKFAKANNLRLKTIRRYAFETTKIFKEAVSLIPFYKSGLFDSLGGSINPIYRFYLYLKDYDLLINEETTFESFLKEFQFSINPGVDDNYKSQMEFLLASLEVEIEEIPQNSYDLAFSLIVNDLNVNSNYRTKSFQAVISDAIMLTRLGEKTPSVNPVDPILCTWDLSLQRVRQKFFERVPNCTQWFMFTPTRLMDHFSMMNFQIKPGSVSNELLSILNESNMEQMTHTLLDSIKILINPENVTGLRYTNMLSEMRKKDILQVEAKSETVSDTNTEALPTEMIFRQLFETYILKKDENESADFKKLFTKEEFFDEVSNILQSEKLYIAQYGKISDSLINKIDSVVEKVSKPNH